MLGLRGEVIVVDDMAYLKTSLTGPLYQQMPIAGDTPGGETGTGGSPDPSAVAEMVAGLARLLAQPGVDPVKGEDVACGSSTCYTVTIELTPEELAALGPTPATSRSPSDLPIPVPGLPDLGEHDRRPDGPRQTDTNAAGRPDRRRSPAATTGRSRRDITFSDWNATVTISRAAGGPGPGRRPLTAIAGGRRCGPGGAADLEWRG